MNEDKTAMIPYFVHEGEMARAERTNKRLWMVKMVNTVVCTPISMMDHTHVVGIAEQEEVMHAAE